MTARCVVLPTREALVPHLPVLQQACVVGIPWLLVNQYLLDTVVGGENRPLAPNVLHTCFLDMYLHSPVLNPRALELVQSDGFARMLYALYMVIFTMHDTVLKGEGIGTIVSSLTHHSWTNQWDLVVLMETTHPHATYARYNPALAL